MVVTLVANDVMLLAFCVIAVLSADDAVPASCDSVVVTLLLILSAVCDNVEMLLYCVFADGEEFSVVTIVLIALLFCVICDFIVAISGAMPSSVISYISSTWLCKPLTDVFNCVMAA